MGFTKLFIWTYVFFAIILLITLSLSPYTALQRTPIQPVIINTNIGQGTSKCTSELINCDTDSDCVKTCKESREGIEMTCQDINRHTNEQIAKYGNSQKVCAPSKAVIECNEKNGGILTWTGFPVLNKMQWNCLCSYPNLASGPGCSLNADVCKGGFYSWDVTNPNNSNLSTAVCQCPADKQLIKGPDNVPRCVPNILGPSFTKKSTKNMYSS